jgi:hypothetical protein
MDTVVAPPAEFVKELFELLRKYGLTIEAGWDVRPAPLSTGGFDLMAQPTIRFRRTDNSDALQRGQTGEARDDESKNNG